MSFPPVLDHLVYAVPDLGEGVAAFEERTGVAPARGGVHPVGTANALVALTVDGERAPYYLEIIGPDPDRADPGPVHVFGIADLDGPRLNAFAVRTDDDLEEVVERARAVGHDPGRIEPWSRATPDGTVLRWLLAKAERPSYPDPVPFLIDWGRTPQPGLGDLPALELLSLRAEHPDPGSLRAVLGALGTDLEVGAGPEPLLEAVLRGPRGEFALR